MDSCPHITHYLYKFRTVSAVSASRNETQRSFSAVCVMSTALMATTLRALLQEPRPAVRRNVDIALIGLHLLGLDNDLVLKQDIESTVDILQS